MAGREDKLVDDFSGMKQYYKRRIQNLEFENKLLWKLLGILFFFCMVSEFATIYLAHCWG